MPSEAEDHKRTKYQELVSMYHFVPLTIETSGAFGPTAAAFIMFYYYYFLTNLDKRVAEQSEETRDFFIFLQHVAVEVQ